VVSQAVGVPPRTRRALLGRSALIVGAGTVLLSGCGNNRHHQAQGTSSGLQDLDVQLLNRSLDLEYKAIAAYTAGIPLLSGRPRDAAKRFLDQELSHSGELAGLVKQAGGKPNRPRSAYDLGHPRSARDVLSLLRELEDREVALYLDAVPRLLSASARAAISAVLGNDAQHLAIVRGALGLDPAPAALVTGGS
jgi:Ferritin-like domain